MPDTHHAADAADALTRLMLDAAARGDHAAIDRLAALTPAEVAGLLAGQDAPSSGDAPPG